MKTYLVVGGSHGICRALATMIAHENHRVIVIGRTPDSFIHEDNITYIQADVLQELPELDDSLNGIAYCPGSIQLKPFRVLKPADFSDDFNINLLGAVRTVQQYLPNLKKAVNSAIVFFSSVAAQTGMIYHTSVAASKGAIEGLTRSLAAELAPHIRVNAIAPSLTETPLSLHLLKTENSRKAAVERHPLKSIGEPSVIAEAAWFVLSDKFSWSTGQIIPVDGGFSSIRNM